MNGRVAFYFAGTNTLNLLPFATNWSAGGSVCGALKGWLVASEALAEFLLKRDR